MKMSSIERTIPALKNIPVPMVPPIAERKKVLDYSTHHYDLGVHTDHCEMPTLHCTMGFIRYLPGSIHFRRAMKLSRTIRRGVPAIVS